MYVLIWNVNANLHQNHEICWLNVMLIKWFVRLWRLHWVVNIFYFMFFIYPLNILKLSFLNNRVKHYSYTFLTSVSSFAIPLLMYRVWSCFSTRKPLETLTCWPVVAAQYIIHIFQSVHVIYAHSIKIFGCKIIKLTKCYRWLMWKKSIVWISLSNRVFNVRI